MKNSSNLEYQALEKSRKPVIIRKILYGLI